MNIRKYAGYFHDGIIHDIKHLSNNVILSMESAQLRPEWNKDNIVLSNRDTISGNLHLNIVKTISIDNKLYKDKLKKKYDDGNIYHLEIRNNKMMLQVSWDNYSVHPHEETDVFTIEVEAKKIIWENIPTLFDAAWEEE